MLGGAKVIAQKIGGDAKEIVFAMGFLAGSERCAQQAQIGFLQQIVGDAGVSGNAAQIPAERRRGLFVEGAELRLVHARSAERLAHGVFPGLVRREGKFRAIERFSLGTHRCNPPQE